MSQPPNPSDLLRHYYSTPDLPHGQIRHLERLQKKARDVGLTVEERLSLFGLHWRGQR